MASLKLLYPQASLDTVAVNITLTTLASDTNLLAGRQAVHIDNSSSLDLDHILGGYIKLGTSPTVSKSVEVWAYTIVKSASGTRTWPDVFVDNSDSAKTITSANIKASGMLRLVASMTSDATTGLVLPFSGVSVKSLFGSMPAYYGLFVTHNTAVALDATGTNHYIGYQRVQAQSV